MYYKHSDLINMAVKCHTSYVDPELRQYIDEVVKKAKEFYDSL